MRFPYEHTIDFEASYQAILNRDRTKDGKLFVCVKTTGIFCRPICPARKPKPENCEFTPSAVHASMMGYRPCKRCRPESLPNSPAWEGTKATITKALKLIENGALDRDTLEGLATSCGMGERHLRRLFTQHLGKSPNAIAQEMRITRAKSLLLKTKTSIEAIADQSGFGSLRRFNSAFKKTTGLSPTQFRMQKDEDHAP